MTILYLSHALAWLSGEAAVYAIAQPKLAYLKRLTDRDARGRFVKREK